ncbi:MAG TPA: FAD-dependent oxidoreductase [Spirochaetia bacterium]|nr:FAD-dependent oxidoreductase [Spirochaetia bacterium]
MTSQKWTRVAQFDDLPDIAARSPRAYRGTKIDVGKDEVLLVRDGNRVFACSNSCPHYGGSLHKGSVRGHVVTCPLHNASFDLEDGTLLTPPALDDLPVFDVKVEDGYVMIGSKRSPAIQMPSGADSRTVIIVGGGAGGNAAAEALRRHGFAGKITIITQESDRPYDRPMLSKGFLSGSAEEGWLPLRPERFYGDLHIQFKRGTAVRTINPALRSVTLGDGTELKADALVFATGSVPRRPQFPGANLDGIFTLRSASDARLIKARVTKKKSVVLLGAGFIGMELASDLTDAGMQVHVVAPEAEPMLLQFGERIGSRVREMHTERGVQFHLGVTASRAAGDRKVEKIFLSDGTEIDTTLVVTAFGVTPAIAFLENTGLLTQGSVRVNSMCETSAPGVYAVGDIAAVPYPGDCGTHRIEHWVVAETQARHAARAILGDRAAFRDLPFFWTRQCEKSIKYIGFPTRFEQIAFRGDPENGSFLAGFYHGERLVGAASLGMSDDLLELEPVIRGEAELSSEEFARS